MNCKFCGEEMSQDSKFCPHCGMENEQQFPEEEIPAASQAEIQAEPEFEPEVEPEVQSEAEPAAQPQSGVTKLKRFAVISGCVAVMAVLALVLFFGVKGESVDVKSWFDWECFRENDIHKQDSYTVSDKKAQKQADVVVATLGDATLTNSQLQTFYRLEVESFLNDCYSNYYSYYYYLYTYYGYGYSSFESYLQDGLGLDYTQRLDKQECSVVEGYTWEQYFLECALATWQQFQCVSLDAKENNFQMDSEMQAYLDTMGETMQETAQSYGYESLDAFFKEQLGANTDLEDYQDYMTLYYTSYLYFAEVYEAIEAPTGEALEAYFKENEETLNGEGIYQDGSYTIDVRHILIAAIDLDDTEYGEDNGDGTFTYPDAELAAEAKARAEEILALWLENPTEDYFAELANEYSEDQGGEVTDGGIYEGVAEGDMVAYFDDWCFDEARVAGDYAIVETKFGYHIMYFVQRGEDNWIVDTQNYYISEVAQQLLQDMNSKYEIQVDYSKIALAYVPMDDGTATA